MRDFFVDLNKLQVIANDEVLEASFTYPLRDVMSYKTKHFHIKYSATSGHIVEVNTTYPILLSGKLADYDETCAIVDSENGDVYTIQELFLQIFDG